ncbi:phosphatidylinositol N-acetylglucosaminyltransferase subunit H-like isoform X2 [Zootermopsis nevadensis]|uniref:phosphatidylinositol N-acetylglucosaminyltransferase subunit H-like isoform X2 n=1 Tax=Zootermopsis nevadensis TaxID=136037 RepID=UPI000B8E95F2|nr:phosphatidylinositol N-acetylglucosaminyltransferase subunit H-like isoform X2 [Zootermopsis nevadensis]
MCVKRVRVSKFTSTQQSVDGRELWLDIVHHDTSNLCFEFTVKGVSVLYTGKEFILSLIVIVSLLATLDIYNPNLCVVAFLIFLIGHLVAKVLWNVNSESLLLVAPVGIQLTATYHSGHQTSQFIPWHFIIDVVINEAITGYRVVYYLAVLVEQPHHATTKKKLIPLFQQMFLCSIQDHAWHVWK